MHLPRTRSDWYLVCVLTGSLAVVVVMYLCVGTQYTSLVPSGTNASECRTFRDRFVQAVRSEGALRATLVLMALHVAHLLLCLPMLHATRMGYGFLLGPLTGGVLCAAWETLVIFVYVFSLHVYRNKAITTLVEASRASHSLFYDLAYVQIASMPLHVAGTLVSFGGVTVREFMLSHTVVTCLMSFKDTLIGVVFAGSPLPRVVVCAGVLIVVSTALPTAMTMYLSVRGFVEVFRALASASQPAADKGYELSVQDDSSKGSATQDCTARDEARE